ncbi:MAG TPA: YncE family protein, partial [Thermoplasmata archaeon]|nr:YncE family protein [Thermoplasmata archaeon]
MTPASTPLIAGCTAQKTSNPIVDSHGGKNPTLEPLAEAFDASNGYVYVANYLANDVGVIDGALQKVVATIAVGAYPDGIAVDSSNGYVYVANDNLSSNGPANVTVIDGATDRVVGSVTVGTCPGGVAVDPSNGYIYVANWCSN